MAKRNLKILVRLDFPAGTVRLWAGDGPYMDADGYVWRGGGAMSAQALQTLEYAFNGELVTFDAWMAGTQEDFADLAYQETQSGDVIGATYQVLTQVCDEYHQPTAANPVVRFTGEIVDAKFRDTVERHEEGSQNLYQVGIVVANRNNLRRLQSGSVLSDADQKARSAVLNPGANADRFCERVPLMSDQVLNWPRFS